MALVTTAEIKTYLRIEHTAEDTMLDSLLAWAKGLAQRVIGVPLAAGSARDFIDDGEMVRAYGQRLALSVPKFPFTTADPDAPVVVDADGDTVDAATYRLEPLSGRIIALDGYSFDNPPYTITAKVGLDAHPDYTEEIEPTLNLALLDLVADRYQRRNPAASSETDNGKSVSFAGELIPARVWGALVALRPGGGLTS